MNVEGKVVCKTCGKVVDDPKEHFIKEHSGFFSTFPNGLFDLIFERV